MTPKFHRVEALPAYQPPVETTSLVTLRKQLKMLADVKEMSGYGMMGLFTGNPGLGKSVAAEAFAANSPLTVLFRITEDPTPRSIAWSLAKALDLNPSGTAYEIKWDIIQTLIVTRKTLVIADEGDYLNARTFDTIRFIYDESGVSIAIISLPRLRMVIRKYKKFRSRVGMRETFEPLTEEEVLNTLLPGLKFPRWQYDLNKEQDRELGLFMWQIVKPSLRNLRDLMLRAMAVAAARGNDQLIDMAIVKNALQKGGTFDNKDTDEDNDDIEKDDEDDEDDEEDGEESEPQKLGKLEQESLRRRRAKRKKK